VTEGVASIQEAESETLVVEIDVHTRGPNAPTGANSDYRFARASRRKKERKITAEALESYAPVKLEPGQKIEVHLVRLASRPLDDDNLQAACKTVRDEIAAWIGLDDADPRFKWSYSQEVVRERKPAPLKGFRTWLRAEMTLSEGEWPKQPPRVKQRPRAPEDEDLVTEGEPPTLGEPTIQWDTKPGDTLAVIHRMGGRNGDTTPAELHVVAKKRPSGEPYVSLSVWFTYNGKRYRSRGAAVRASELPAVVEALQGYMATHDTERPPPQGEGQGPGREP
jgi:hypothetical protein